MCAPVLIMWLLIYPAALPSTIFESTRHTSPRHLIIIGKNGILSPSSAVNQGQCLWQTTEIPTTGAKNVGYVVQKRDKRSMKRGSDDIVVLVRLWKVRNVNIKAKP
ncbi:hypothetical protein B0H10DRAFT_1950991 [Mycena sp. CBHHK59/15]|nr:hypothetical protein B0H10DRAFT_1950991 [Mycena sp. CBHHK59/15]